MTVITTFTEKRREKQIKYERSILRELSIKMLKNKFQDFFGEIRLNNRFWLRSGIEEACYDIAIEAFLLGAKMSKFGYYGESIDIVRLRCERELKHFIETLYNFFLYWGNGEEGIFSESLYYLCEQYAEYWWREGFIKGERRRKLRLH
ncbi:conserved hypothetical cytosolic protein [Bacillus methanolicus PB1]|uniref:Conserved hypothetical cytosolic protein n=1 Tax=Bacillus methanolicus PB1 TaxID=997296 RepID=I3E0G3_BACMT|nr:YbaK family protein [Bacillus methanolicus]EIJ79984.1 conserved hypothetical cytosolic protein [Bacillus methanolicus PB1]